MPVDITATITAEDNITILINSGERGGPGPTGPEADIAAQINAATAKTTPADADEIGGTDSAAGFGLKKFTLANIKAVFKTYFDTLYATVSNLALKAPIDSPAFTGTPTTPYSGIGPSQESIVNVQYVQEGIDLLVGAAPQNLNSITKLAASLGNDADFSGTMDTAFDVNATNLTNHETDMANPHQTTAAQVGLGNVDNTADATLKAGINGMISTLNSTTDALVVVVSGQSNASGAAVGGTLPTTGSLPNVKFVKEGELEFTSHVQSQTNCYTNGDSGNYSTALAFAKKWQTEITGGADLPDLYMVIAAKSSAGFDSGALVTVPTRHLLRSDMLYPDGTTNVYDGIFERIRSTIPTALSKLAATKRVVVGGFIWLQGETDSVQASSANTYAQSYSLFLKQIQNLLGENVPIMQTVMRSESVAYTATATVNTALESVGSSLRNLVELDCYSAPNYDIGDDTLSGGLHNAPNRGVFADAVHYNDTTCDYFAGVIYAEIVTNGNAGIIYDPLPVHTPRFQVMASSLAGTDNGVQHDGGGAFSKSGATATFSDCYTFDGATSGDFRIRASLNGATSSVLSAGTPSHLPATDPDFAIYTLDGSNRLLASKNTPLSGNTVDIETGIGVADNYLVEISRVNGEVFFAYSSDAGANWLPIARPDNAINTDELTFKLAIYEVASTVSAASIIYEST